MKKDIDDVAIEEFNKLNPIFPIKCPICGKEAVHLYFHRHDERHAGGWAWCSECKENQHFSFLIPEWWSNLSCISLEGLGGTFPKNLENFRETIDEHVNNILKIQNPNLDMCGSCVYKNPKETIEICPKCNNETLHCYGDGSGCSCTNCGYGWATSPKFPPCRIDDKEYVITISFADKSQYIGIAKLASCNVVELKNKLDEGIPIEIKGRIWEMVKVAIQLEKLGVAFKVEPNLFNKYYDIKTCKH